MELGSLITPILAGAGVLASLLWLGQWLTLLWNRKNVVYLAELPGAAPPGGWPTLAVIFAARNEAVSVEKAARSLLAQDYPNLQLIAVDDRSTDGTGAILEALAAENPRLQVVHVRELPPGWLGKNHALHVAVQSTAAEWLLFTDADVVFAPGTLRKALARAVTEQADHVTVIPEVPNETVGEKLFMAMFGLIFSLYAPQWAVEDPRRQAALGIGAFNLVRGTAFRAIGGLERLALSVDDDMRLGRVLKLAGYRPRVLQGLGAVSVRWQIGLRGMIRGMEKNFFVGTDYRLPVALLVALGFFWAGAAPHIGLLVGPWWTRAICAAGIVALMGTLARTGRQSHIGWYYGLVTPLCAMLVDIALLRSVWLTLARGGVRWREHLYPLAELRQHVRERDLWTRKLWQTTQRNRRGEPPAPVPAEPTAS
jgi:hypothetical protein